MLGERAAVLAPALALLATDPDPALRRAAIQAGAGGLDLREMLAAEQSSALRRACLAALAREEGPAALPDLLVARQGEVGADQLQPVARRERVPGRGAQEAVVTAVGGVVGR